MKNLFILPVILLFACFNLSAQVSVVPADCGQAYFDDYSDSTKWTYVGEGRRVQITEGVCAMFNARCGRYDKVYHELPFTLSNTYWKAEFSYIIARTNPGGHGAGAVAFAATAGTEDFLVYDSTGNFTLTKQNGLGVTLTSPGTSDDNIANWQFAIEEKTDDSTRTISQGITSDPGAPVYYIRLERFIDSARLSIFSDEAMLQHLPGSPIVMAIHQDNTGFNVLQHGVITFGFNLRINNAEIDNLLICDAQFTGVQEVNNEAKAISTYPNPATGKVFFDLPSYPADVIICNALGQQVYAGEMKEDGLDVSILPAGIYILKNTRGSELFTAKFMVQR